MLFLVWLLVLLCPASGIAASEPLKLQLKWGHQFQFAGYYAAIAQGYYEEEGLSVELLPAHPGLDPIVEVLQGRAEFGIGTSDLLLHFHQGDPVVALAVTFQHSPLVLISRTENRLQTLRDLNHHSVAIEPGSAELFAYLKREGVSIDQFDVVLHEYNLMPLIIGRVAAQSVYSTTETFELEQQGISYHLYSPRSVGIDFYGDTLFTTQALLTENTEQIEAFRRASMRGWLYAMHNTEEIIDLILEEYPTQRTREALRYEANEMQRLMRTDLIEPGHMIIGRWQHMADVYAEIGMLPENISLEGFLHLPKPKQPIDLTRIYYGLILACILAAIFASVASIMIYYNKQLRKSEQKFRTLFDDAPVAFMVLDHQGYIKDWNTSASHIFGWPHHEIIGLNILGTIIKSEDQSMFKDVMITTLREGHSVSLINKNFTRDGKEITCEWVNSPYPYTRDGDEGMILSIGMDVTERVAIEKALRQARDDANDALDEHIQLISMLSHEIRSPLATIATANAVLKAALAQGNFSDSSAMNQRINAAIHRLRSFLDNLTADDRLSTTNLTNRRVMVDLPAVVQQSINAIHNTYPLRNISTSVCGPAMVLSPDPVLLDIVITNLLDNAMKYSPKDTEVSICVISQDNHAISLKVHNHGTGIPAPSQAKIFRKYFRGEHVDNTSGTGVGLYLVKRIVDSNNGTIDMMSSDTDGTLFHVTFPPCKQA
ncbi:ABC transporter substrate-binding protein [Nitrincola sp. A-D6]|uniref:ABC transporter substrate-binding protein n=1 Tax=Nitrincola sp. A-D6 TaxID=1545442 RepID=UPI00068F3356|nr:ABC transporter substrate-binding protein [Nitrincola sp. A-D6]